VRARRGTFNNWEPKLIKYISPQVWASREGRAFKIARDFDLLLSIFPFEKDWYAKRVPKLRVEFVGHPMVGRFQKSEVRSQKSEVSMASPQILLLPGSRRGELQKHLPPMLGALKLIQEKRPTAKAKMVLPDDSLVQLAKSLGVTANVEIQIGDLPKALAEADVAIASTGTVTMECAFFGVPTVTLYKTSWFTYEIAKRIVTVKSLTMPNILAGEEIYPEFVQGDATPENISCAALELLQDESRRTKIKSQLAKIISSLGETGAAGRAATAILSLFP
jgi:lipid-A-disaccharide synthase